MADDKEAKHVVVVDDEQDIRETVRDYLEMHGYRVSEADGGVALREIIADEDETVDLVLLDITMPGEDGLSLARFLTETTNIGLIMMTASGEIIDRVVGLEMGADDYLPKPVDMRELLARTKAVLRRVQNQEATGAAAPTGEPTTRVQFGTCVLDLDAHKLFNSEGEEVEITAMEFDLLKAFAERPNRVLSRDQLLELAHNKGWEPFDRSIDVRVTRLRKKVEKDPTKPQVIKTVRGAGYVFEPPSRQGAV